ncbi:MAG: hypothetical protein K2I19_06690, partial [Muribaculaceae bacterium]|nr:hypothetical protein [Muribaculaceae bacterium]
MFVVGLVFRLTNARGTEYLQPGLKRAKDSAAKLDIDAFVSNFLPTTLIRHTPKPLRFYYFTTPQYTE